MNRAREEALRMDAVAVDVEHVLLGLLGVHKGVAYFALKKYRLFWMPVHEHLWNQARDKRDSSGDNIWPSENIHALTYRAFELSKESKEDFIDSEHLLLALIETKSWRTRDVFDNFAVDIEGLRREVLHTASMKGKRSGEEVFERFSKQESRMGLIDCAREEARSSGHSFIGTEQLFLALLREGKSSARILCRFGVTYVRAKKEIEVIIGRGSGGMRQEIPFSPRAKRVLELSFDESRQLNHNFICAEHILLGLIREQDTVAWRVLDNFKIDLDQLRKAVVDSFSEEGDEGFSSGVAAPR